MSDPNTATTTSQHKNLAFWVLSGLFLLAAALLGGIGVLVFRDPSISRLFSSLVTWLFSANSVHTTWYITRAAGWVAYFLLWFSMVWGLAIPTKFFERLLSPTFIVDFHEYISLLSIGFIILHVGVLTIDQYLPFTLVQILVPFLSAYRPVWIGFGTLGAYLAILVTVTFYLRKRIGQKRFKSIHMLSLLSYLGVIFHAFFAGSDSSLLSAQLIYLSTFLVVIFLTAYWLILGREAKKLKEARPILPNATHPVRR